MPTYSLLRRVALMSCIAAAPAVAAPPWVPTWVPTWVASQQPVWRANELPLSTGLPARLDDRTVRQVARVSLGGSRVRVVLSNQYGRVPLTVDAIQLARHAGGGTTDPATHHAVTFAGKPAVSIPPGTTATSDPVPLPVPLPALAEVAVTFHLPGPVQIDTFHWDGRQTAYIADGHHVADATLPRPETFQARLLLSAIEVEAPQPAPVIVALGDSITEGNGATPDANRRWPDVLATRLAGDGIAVLNAGISGGQLLRAGMGEAGRARFERDVLDVPGVQAVIVALGINDIGWPGSTFLPVTRLPAAADLIAGYQSLIDHAHRRGVRVVGATITPFAGALAVEGSPIHGYATPAKEALRQRVNDWIRTSGAFDAVADFDAALRDPARPDALQPALDSGDHLHPGDRGYAAMAGAIDPAALLPARQP